MAKANAEIITNIPNISCSFVWRRNLTKYINNKNKEFTINNLINCLLKWNKYLTLAAIYIWIKWNRYVNEKAIPNPFNP